MFLFAALLLALTGAARAAPSVSSVAGSVFVLRTGTRVWQPAAAGHLLETGDQVRTVAGASAVITFDDGSRINLGSNGSFTLQESTSGGTSLKLSIGSLRAWVNKALSRRFDVRTPTAVCSVRGTEFAVDVNAQGHTNIQMFSGALAVADGRGNETVIRDRDNLRVTDKGFSGGGQTAAQVTTGKDRLREQAKREVGLEMSKEAVQAAAAAESVNAVYKEGKTLIDVNGFRVRLEEYIVRPDPSSFKLVVLNERENRFDYFYYKGTFNTTLPDDLSVALRQLPGCVGAPCQYVMTAYETARSNTQDNMLEVSSGGHGVDVNNNGVAGDAVYAAYDPVTDMFLPLSVPNPGGVGNQSFFQTLYDYNKLTFNGVPHNGWVPQGGAVTNYGAGAGGINTAAVAADMANPAGGNISPASLTTVRNMPVCAPPNCTYNESGVQHGVIYASNGDGTVWEKYDSYIISDEGKIATTGDFMGTTTGTLYKQTLLKWNFQTVVTASEFSGRKIDLVVEPKIFIQSGLIQ